MRAAAAKRADPAWILAAFLCAACSPGEERPSVLLISVDTLRRDHVSAYGYPRRTTPFLDRIAREGALFQRALSTSNWTLPAHMSLLTGLSPSRHGVEDERDRLPGRFRTLAEDFRDEGYRTAGFASHIYLDGSYGFARGFETWEVDADQRASRVSERATAWLEREGAEPFFLFLHYFDPHWDYDPPARYRHRFGSPPREAGRLARLNPYRDPRTTLGPTLLEDVTALYDGEVAYTDAAVGRVLRWLGDEGRLDDVVVAVVSDHGEEFGDHGGFGHGTHLHGEVTRVPFLLRFPGAVAPGRRPSEVVSLLDLPATLLELAGLPSEPQFLREGRALLGGEPARGDRAVVLESTRNGPKRFAVHRGDYAYLGAGSYRLLEFEERDGEIAAVEGERVRLEPALFDVVRDPGERRNLLDRPGHGERVASLRERLRRFARGASGLRLSCARDGSGSVRGELRFQSPLRDEPWVVAEGGPRTGVEALEAGRFRVALRPGTEPATVVFPVAEPAETVHLRLLDGESATREEPAIPVEGGSVRVGPGGRCRLTSRGLDAAGPRMELEPEERARLRALGYAE